MKPALHQRAGPGRHPLHRAGVALTLCASLCLSLCAAQTNTTAVQTELLQSAQMWLDKNRPDRARQSLNKLLAMNPGSVPAVVMGVEIALRENQLDEARRLVEQLRTQHPPESVMRDLDTLLRVAGPQREQLARMRLAQRSGQQEQARALARELFPQGAPQLGQLGAEVRAILSPAANDAPAKSAPASAQNPSATVSASADPLRAPRQAAQEAMDRNQLEQARVQWLSILEKHPKDAESIGGLGLVYMRQGRHEQAEPLFAQAYALDGQQKWRDLRKTSAFWATLARANTALDQSQWELAQQELDRALSLEPQQPNALSTLAALRQQQGRTQEAQTLYQTVLQKEPDQRSALRGLSLLWAQQHQYEQALNLLQTAQKNYPALQDSLKPIQAQVLQEQAKALMEDQRHSQARQRLEQAVQLAPADPWGRYRLATLYRQLNLPDKASQVMDEGVELQPENQDMRYARALTRSAQGDAQGALQDMAYIPQAQRSSGMHELQQRASIDWAVQQAAQQPSTASDKLRAAESIAAQQAQHLFTVSNAWFRMGEPEQGLAVYERLAQRHPQQDWNEELWLDYAGFLNRARHDETLGKIWPELNRSRQWSTEQQVKLLNIQTDHLERRIQEVQKASLPSDQERALQLASAGQAELIKPQPFDAPHQALHQHAQARLLVAAAQYDAGIALMRQALIQRPEDVALHLDLAQALVLKGDTAQAREQALWLQDNIPAKDLGQQLALLRLWQRMGAYEQARAQARTLQERFGQDVDVLQHMARLERNTGEYAQALNLYRQVLNLQRSSTSTPNSDMQVVQEEISSIEARGLSWVEMGMQRLKKRSTPGISTVQGWEIPMVAWMADGYKGHYFVHADAVRLDAGSLSAERNDVLDFGQIAAWPEQSYTQQWAHQHSSGANVGFGYQTDATRWDIGAVGVGMTTTNWVGGWRQNGNWKDLGYQWEISRRPLTGSLLAYAGAVDPITSNAWGGVVANAVGASVSTQWQGLGVSSSASYALLTGRHVRDNTRLQWRGSLDKDVYRSQRQQVNVGLALSAWHFGHDLSNYTYGQGGYYSPEQYRAVSLPLEWTGYTGLWSWSVRAATSYSHSSSGSSPYFPLDPTLQQQAQAQLGEPAVFAPSSGGGWGYSVRAAVEYRAAPQWALGALLEIDRSDFYAPTNLMLYMRYWFDKGAPVAQRPRPVQSYSSF